MRLTACLLAWLLLPSAEGFELRELVPEARYDATVPSPGNHFPRPPGEQHLRHDQLLDYYRVLAAGSDRVELWETGRTHEARAQVLLAISHPDNLARLEDLREQHLAYIGGESREEGPVIVWLGYSIHGNEASGANAAPLVAYHLAADAKLEDWLREAVVLIDPALNPDGLGRFAHWANMHRSYSPLADPASREHNEHWPGGRFNHYWFDLNRDWLLLVHPESRNRVRIFQSWRPHVFADFHEMGSDATYFFQPGVPERRNPLTPDANVELTERLAAFHAEALDQVGQLYFSEEVFDDFYYGKGSTYPDVQGSVGILFEQAAVRALRRETRNGEVAFSWAVRNQFLTSLSTVRGAVALADDLRQNQRAWVTGAGERAAGLPHAAWVFGGGEAPYRTRAMAERLLAHGIAVHELASAVEVEGHRFEAGESLVVPVDQPQVTLLEALFETRLAFEDSTFYDVSTWTFPLAFDLPYAPLRRVAGLLGAPFDPDAGPRHAAPDPEAYAWLVEWQHYLAPKALVRLQEAEIPVRVATEPFTVAVDGGTRAFERGTLLVPRGLAPDPARAHAVLARVVAEDGVEVFSVDTGLTPQGPDLGSRSFAPLDPVRPILVVGRGVRPMEAGEVWHLLDTRYGLAPVMVDLDRLGEIALEDYTHLLMVGGSYRRLDETLGERIAGWVRAGGVLVASKEAAAWATRAGLGAGEEAEEDAEEHENDTDEAPEYRPYAQHEDDFSQTVIGGAIVSAAVDLTHPLAYGYQDETLALFRNGTVFLEPSDNPYETPLRYTEEPLLSGFLGAARREQLAGSAAVIASRLGRGTVIRMADNPNFRGYWYGSNRLYLNALFLGGIIERTPVPDTDTRL